MDAATAAPTATAASVMVIANHEVTVAANAGASGVTLEPQARLNIDSETTLTIAGDLTLQSSSSGTATLLNNGTLSVSGTTTVQQHLVAKTGEATSDNWWYIASPVSGATSASILVDGSSNQFGYYNETNASYPQITATNVPLEVGRGYLARINTTGTYSFTGTLNNGNVGPITLTRTPAAGLPRGFNLVGNPYPSHLNWNAITGFGTQNLRTDIRPTVWVRTRTAGGAMGFDTFDGEDAVTVGNRGTMNQYIAPMQAFWVKVNEDNTSPTITFTNAMRSQQNQSVNSNRLRMPAQTSRQLLRLELDNGVNTDQLLISTNESAQNGYDFYDSEKISANTSEIAELYALVGNRELVINKRRDISEGAAVILGFRPGKAGSFTIRASELTNLSHLRIVLRDHLLNTEAELNITSEYAFTADETTTNDRFSIEFRAPGVVTVNEDLLAANTVVYVNDANQITVQSAGLTNTDRISVFNLAGQQLISTPASGTVTVLEMPLSSGVYMVRVNSHIHKVVVK